MISLQRLSYSAFRRFCQLLPAMPSKPTPRSTRLAGSGTLGRGPELPEAPIKPVRPAPGPEVLPLMASTMKYSAPSPCGPAARFNNCSTSVRLLPLLTVKNTVCKALGDPALGAVVAPASLTYPNPSKCRSCVASLMEPLD